MAKFDIGKSLKIAQDKFQDSAKIIKKSVDEMDIKIPDIPTEDIKNAASRAAENVKESAEKAGAGLKKVAEGASESVKSALERKDTEDKLEDASIRVLSTDSALEIIYYLISSDGNIKDSELAKFDEIGLALDPGFEEKKEKLIEKCKKELSKAIDDADFYDVLQEAVEKSIIGSRPTQDSYITPKLLLWNLLSIAYSDEVYSEEERRLMKYLVRKMEVDKAVFLELEHTMLAARDVEKEIEWIKSTNKPYLTVEPIVNELTDRRNVIFESAKELIML